MKSFICLGLATLDNTWFVPHIPAQPQKVLARNFLCSGGGMAATAAVTIARLGAPVSFWGRRGDDESGDTMASQLAEEKINIDHFRRFDNAGSPVAAVLVDPNGERLISTYQGHSLPPDPNWLPLKQVPHSAAVLADMRWIEGAAALFQRSRNEQIPNVLDADIAQPSEYEQLLPHCDHAIFSAAGLTTFAPDCAVDQALQKAARFGCSITAVSNGTQGIRWYDGKHFKHTPAYRVDAADTTGAGDVLHGAYTWAIGHSYKVDDAMQFASATAALACQHPGARTGIPNLNQVQLFMDRQYA